MLKIVFLLSMPLFLFSSSIMIQILGSGGPEFSKRASSSYLIWVDNQAKVLVDMGGGSFTRFAQSAAKIEDLSLIALTHLHIDHAADLPAFMKAGFFTNRTKSLPILGTISSGDFPDIQIYLERLFGKNGAYAYMQDILTPQSDSFQIIPIMIAQEMSTVTIKGIKVTSIGVHHGPVPALAFSFEIDGKKIVFTGDTSATSDNLITLARGADYLIANHAIAQHAGSYAKKLHMTPKRIGEIAQKAHVKNLILSHRMKRTYNKETESERAIRENFKKRIIWAEDLMKVQVK